MISICQFISRNTCPGQIALQRKICLHFNHRHNLAINCVLRKSLWSDANVKTVNYYIRIPAVFGILSIGVLIASRVKSKLKENSPEIYPVPIPSGLFQSKLSLYRYKNYVFPSRILLFGDKSLEEFTFRESDVIVASFPKTGTTWVQEIVSMLCSDCKSSDDSSKFLETRFPYLEYPYPGTKAIEKIDGQRLIKTHLPFPVLPKSFNEVKPKLIYVTRNPRDITVSYFHFMKLVVESNFVGSFSQFVDLFISNKVPYSPLSDHIRSYTEKLASYNILLVSFEELKINPTKVISDIATFLEIDVDSNDIASVVEATKFSSMKTNSSVNYEHWKEFGFANPNETFLRKGEIGDWKNYFDIETLAKFTDWEKAQQFPIEFKYEP